MEGLLIRQPWIDRILSGEKTWEIRSRKTSKRGPIALIQSGSGSVVGMCTLEDVIGPLSVSEMKRNVAKHGIPAKDCPLIHYNKIYAWVIDDARRFERPVPYDHPQGAVIWVKLPHGPDDLRRLGGSPDLKKYTF